MPSERIIFVTDITPGKTISRTDVDEKNPILLAQIDGSLSVYLDGILFFHDSAILLLEFATKAKKWLLDNVDEDIHFEYYTMDHAEGPILAVKKDNVGNWHFESVWSEYTSAEIFQKSEVVSAFRKCLVALEGAIKEHYSIDVNGFLSC